MFFEKSSAFENDVNIHFLIPILCLAENASNNFFLFLSLQRHLQPTFFSRKTFFKISSELKKKHKSPFLAISSVRAKRVKIVFSNCLQSVFSRTWSVILQGLGFLDGKLRQIYALLKNYLLANELKQKLL